MNQDILTGESLIKFIEANPQFKLLPINFLFVELLKRNLIQPIPLTKRILRKNGFYPCEYAPNIYERENDYEGIYFRIEVRFDRRIIYLHANYHNGYRRINKHAKIEGCEIYVHQLQQALRLGGLTEMANNFKV